MENDSVESNRILVVVVCRCNNNRNHDLMMVDTRQFDTVEGRNRIVQERELMLEEREWIEMLHEEIRYESTLELDGTYVLVDYRRSFYIH